MYKIQINTQREKFNIFKSYEYEYYIIYIIIISVKA